MTAQRYGGEYLSAPTVADLDVPVVLESMLYDRVDELERSLARQAAELEAAKRRAEMTEADRIELEQARTKERGRKKYERRMERQRTKHRKDRN